MVKNYLKKAGIALFVVLAFWLTFNFGYFVRWIEASAVQELAVWGRLFLRESAKIVFILLVSLPVAKFVEDDISVFGMLGLANNPLHGLGRAALSILPMLTGYAVLFSLNPDFSIYLFFSKSFFPGITEEIIYRAFFFGIFFYQLKVGFIPSILTVSLLFGYMHFAQSDVLIESLSIFAITAMGSALFAWLYVEWGRDLWFPIFLHMFMNLAWGLFDTGVNTALGSWGLNIFRILTITVAILITVKKVRQSKSYLKGRLWKLQYSK